eukprot:Trichotokara_eunicae@DN10166_c0_g1_i1.p1
MKLDHEREIREHADVFLEEKQQIQQRLKNERHETSRALEEKIDSTEAEVKALREDLLHEKSKCSELEISMEAFKRNTSDLNSKNEVLIKLEDDLRTLKENHRTIVNEKEENQELFRQTLDTLKKKEDEAQASV